MQRTQWVVVLMFLMKFWALGQTLVLRPADPSPGLSTSVPANSPALSIPLTVPAGAPLKVALDRDVRVEKVGQRVHGKTLEPVYAFHKLVVPVGSEVIGTVTSIESISKKRRTVAALNADLSPSRAVQIEFNELVLASGRHVPIQTEVLPESAGATQLVPADRKCAKGNQNIAVRKIHDVHRQLKGRWDNAKHQISAPAKIHRLERYAFTRLPYHPQYLDSGSSFVANLKRPIDFGTEAVDPEILSTVGDTPPSGSLAHALLVTPLSSATSKKGDLVQAVMSRPMLVSDHLLFPEGSRLEGTVIQVRPAGKFGRNGQLRIVFHQIAPPSGSQHRIEGSLEGIVVAKGDHLKLDSEGGARLITPDSRYLRTGLSVMSAASLLAADGDYHGHISLGNKQSPGMRMGPLNLRFLGSVASTLSHSRAVASGFSMYGASMSVYSTFLARGRDVVFRKDMSMIVGLGAREVVRSASEDVGPTIRQGARSFGPL